MYLELRFVTDDNQSIAGVRSPPITEERLRSPEIFKDIEDCALTLVGLTRTSPVKSPPEKTAEKAPGIHLRQLAEQVDSGKYVVTVHSQSAEGGRRVLTILLDPNKS